MLTETFTHVEGDEAIQSGIQRGSRYRGKKYGAESPDTRYVQDGLYPEIGEQPLCDHAIQTISGPVFVINEENKQVSKTWAVEDKAVETIRAEIQAENKESCEQHILSAYPVAIQNSMNAGIYSVAATDDYKGFLAGCIAEENRVFDLVEVSSDPVNIEKPVWPEV